MKTFLVSKPQNWGCGCLTSLLVITMVKAMTLCGLLKNLGFRWKILQWKQREFQSRELHAMLEAIDKGILMEGERG